MKTNLKNTPIPGFAWSYSPLPKDAYAATGGKGILYGPPEDWNLGWLGHAYETQKFPKDPAYAVHVMRTCQVLLQQGAPETSDLAPAHLKLRGWMRLDPKQAVANILAYKHLSSLPLMQAYGTRWLETIQRRVEACQANPGTALNQLIDAPVPDMAGAQDFLARFRKPAQNPLHSQGPA